ncbi:flagellin [Sphingomonas sp. CJ99]
MTAISATSRAARAAAAAATAAQKLNRSADRLATGKRINSAADDAGGLGVAASMTAQLRGYAQGVRNAQDGIAMAQTAEGAMVEMTSMLQRMRELAVQSATGTITDDDRANLQAEVAQLKTQMSEAVTGATFNDIALFAEGGSSFGIQVGANGDRSVALSIDDLALSAVTGGTVSVPGTGALMVVGTTPGALPEGSGKYITQEDVDNGAMIYNYLTNSLMPIQQSSVGGYQGLTNGESYWDPQGGGTTTVSSGISVATADEAVASLQTLDDALTRVTQGRAEVGATISRLESVAKGLDNGAGHLAEARSRIEDADYASEATQLAQWQILSQSSTAMIAQANLSQRDVTALLR